MMSIAIWKNPPRGLEGPADPADLPGSLRRHAAIGICVVAALFLGLGGWAVVTEIAGAVMANGVVVVEGGSKKVQHPDGGVVKEILVKDDDRVKAGQLLVRLDDVAVRAELDVILSQLRDAIGADARLSAESIDAPAMVMPAIVSNWPADPEMAAIMGEQEKLRQARRKSLESQARQLDQQVAEKRSEVGGLEAQQEANRRQLKLYDSENANLGKLKSSGLVGDQRVNEMKRSQAELEGQIGSIDAKIAAAKASINQLEMQRTQLYVDFRAQVLTDLQDASQSVAELLQKKIAAEQKLSRLDIRAPISGVVHESTVHTVGGVVGEGETLMMIVPQDTKLLVDTRVSPLDIDKLHVDQVVDVRLTGFDTRTTPELKGTVKAISPDLTRDDTTGAQFYSVRVEVPDSELSRLPDHARLVPGMPVETFIQTGNRTVWSYLTHPFTEALTHSFRD